MVVNGCEWLCNRCERLNEWLYKIILNMNYIMFVTNQYFVFINSSGTDENFTYNIQFPQGFDFTHVVCLNALIPKSYYLIPSGPFENAFQLKENNITVTVTVPTGSYLLSAFQTVIGTLLTNASPNGLTYTVSFSERSRYRKIDIHTHEWCNRFIIDIQHPPL